MQIKVIIELTPSELSEAVAELCGNIPESQKGDVSVLSQSVTKLINALRDWQKGIK